MLNNILSTLDTERKKEKLYESAEIWRLKEQNEEGN